MKSKNEVFEIMKSKGYSISNLEKQIVEMKRNIISFKASIKHCEKFPQDCMIFFLNCENINVAKKELSEIETIMEWIVEYKNTYLTK